MWLCFKVKEMLFLQTKQVRMSAWNSIKPLSPLCFFCYLFLPNMYNNILLHIIKACMLFYLSQEFVSEFVLSHVCDAGFCSNQASVKYLIEWTLILILHQYPCHIQNLWNCFSLVSLNSWFITASSVPNLCHRLNLKLTIPSFEYFFSEVQKNACNKMNYVVVFDISIFVLQDHEKTKTSICTFLSVLVHLNVLLPKLDEKVQHERSSYYFLTF